MKVFLLALIMSFSVCQDKEVYLVGEVDTQPEYKGGLQSFYSYIKKNFKPTIKPKGRVLVEFIIDTKGKVRDAKIYFAQDDCCNKEILEVFKKSAPWKPGKHKGEKVKVKIIVPLMFYENQKP